MKYLLKAIILAAGGARKDGRPHHRRTRAGALGPLLLPDGSFAGVGKLTGWVMGLTEADQGAGGEAEAGACFLPLIADPPRKHLSEQPAATAHPLWASEPRVWADVHVVLGPLECQIRLTQRQTPFWL